MQIDPDLGVRRDSFSFGLGGIRRDQFGYKFVVLKTYERIKYMPLIHSYGVWNNKGGVGKSTITFHAATTYAETHPRAKVLVIDLCPQSNVSMILLGGGTEGEERVMNYCLAAEPRTVSGYVTRILAGGVGAIPPNPSAYLIRPHEINERVAENIHLLCGDWNLEPMVPLINERARLDRLPPLEAPWKWVHLIIRRLIETVTSGDDNWMVFVDTNPSFSVYTEMAISSVDRLIVPVNADDSSRVATSALFTLIYGSEPPHPIYGRYTYARRSSDEELAKPLIHLIVGNRLTQYDGAATAFAAVSDATANQLYQAFSANPDRFTPAPRAVRNATQFRDAFAVALRDFNTAGVVAAHLGMPLSQLRGVQYDVHGRAVTLHPERIDECQRAMASLSARL